MRTRSAVSQIIGLLLSVVLTTAIPLATWADPTCASLFDPPQKPTAISRALDKLAASAMKPKQAPRPPRDLSDISDSEFAAVRNIGSQIIEKYSNNDFVYVGIGRSPTPFMALFQAMGLESIVNLPLSAMRSHPSTGVFQMLTNYSSKFDMALTWSQRKRLFKHFHEFLPAPESLQGKKILLIDVATSGASLISAFEYVSLYYKSIAADVDVRALAIVEAGTYSEHSPLLKQHSRLVTNFGAYRSAYQNQSYDTLSAHGSHYLYEKSNLKTNPDYIKLVQDFANRLENEKASGIAHGL